MLRTSHVDFSTILSGSISTKHSTMAEESLREAMTASEHPPTPDLSILSIAPQSAPSRQISSSPPSSPSQTPPHRSHDPAANLKRSDPFQFGSRYLLPTDDVFEFNAWDHVPTTSDYDTYAETQYASQRSNPVSNYDRTRFNANPEKWWNRFYTNNTSNFFKDRKWLQQEFPILRRVTEKGAGRKVMLEVGAGAGNTAFPIMKGNENEELVLHACDFSRKAVEVIRGSPLFAEQQCGRMKASIWDIASDELPDGLEEGGVDVVLLIFILSALNPQQWNAAIRNVWRLLKPGGEVCFRDYGRGDLAQVRFKKGRWMEDNFYVRGDGTRVYFFSEEELRNIWGGRSRNATHERRTEAHSNGTREETHMPVGDREEEAEERGDLNNERKGNKDDPAFEIVSLGVDRRLLVNRQRKLKMYRCWMQGRFRKPGANV